MKRTGTTRLGAVGRFGASKVRRVWLVLCLLACGCASAPKTEQAPIDTSAPGWEMRQGQAVWKPGADKPEIAGDVVLSTHAASGTAHIIFSKTLPIVSGRLGSGAWSIDFAPENKSYSGHGDPPKRIVWLQMLRALEGSKSPERWKVIHPSTDYIALEDLDSGERLEVHFQK